MALFVISHTSILSWWLVHLAAGYCTSRNSENGKENHRVVLVSFSSGRVARTHLDTNPIKNHSLRNWVLGPSRNEERKGEGKSLMFKPQPLPKTLSRSCCSWCVLCVSTPPLSFPPPPPDASYSHISRSPSLYRLPFLLQSPSF